MYKDRALWLALSVLALTFSAYSLRENGRAGVPWLPPCYFKKITTLNCPGCGMTRAAFATLHGQIGAAFRFNPVGMILGPLACIGIGLELLGWVRGKEPPFRLKVGKIGSWVIFWVVMSFWILRNIPYWPFTLLSPP